MTRKPKILMATEASFLSTGFANYTRELLTRLHATNKYDIAEFSAYGHVNDPKDVGISWKYYANAVRPNDKRYQEYMSSADNQFGRWRFDQVVLDFKPDAVIDIRDYWMSNYEQFSSFRDFFHWILMPTVDSAPQQQTWLDTYESADAIFTYSDFGAKTLKQQTNDNVNYIETVSPGIDLNTFFPETEENRQLLKQQMGIPVDSIIIGSVMRNQKRKLIPELVKSFRITLDYYREKNPEIADKMYLYLHTSFPDAGWDLPEILKDEQVLNKTIITYNCEQCNNISPSNFVGPRAICPFCHNKTRIIPSVAQGVSVETLRRIYSIMDIYVQYAICEGFGMPQVEAAACGVPVATVNYSAMEDVVEKLEAYPISIGSYFKELETKAVRVYPDNQSLKNILIEFLNKTEKEKQDIRARTRALTEKHYNWENIAKKWQNYLDTIPSSEAKWGRPPNFLVPIDPNICNENPHNINYMALMTSICINNLKNIKLISSKRILNILQNLEYGYVQQGPNARPYGLKQAVEELNIYIQNINNSEKARTSNYKSQEDYIKYSKIKAST
jgi:glycosyltransferase involved in cell wall biosynthesis